LCLLGLPGAAWAGHAYVSNEDDHTVTVLDTNRGVAVATIAVGKRPRGMKLSHDGTHLFVAVSGLPKCPPSVSDEDCAKLQRDLTADGIAVVDTHTLKVVKLLQAGSDPEQFDVDRDSRRLYVSNEDSATTSVVDVQKGMVLTRIPVGHEPEGVRLTPNGAWVLVTSETDNSVSIIDTHLLQSAHIVNVGKRPRDAAITPDGHTAYVTGEFDASVYKIGLPGGTPVEKLLQLRKDDRPMSILFDASRQRLYVSTGRGGSIAVIALQGPRLVNEVQVGARPWGIAMTPDARLLFTANGPSNDVSIVDLATLKVMKKVPVGRSPWGVVIGR
jgi:YVTN family beta-propeller protein